MNKIEIEKSQQIVNDVPREVEYTISKTPIMIGGGLYCSRTTLHLNEQEFKELAEKINSVLNKK